MAFFSWLRFFFFNNTLLSFIIFSSWSNDKETQCVCVYIDNLNVKQKKRKNNNIKNPQKWKWKRTGETESFRRFFFSSSEYEYFVFFVYAMKVETKTWFWIKEIQQPNVRINAGSKRHKTNQSRHSLSITMAWISLCWEQNFLKCMEKKRAKKRKKNNNNCRRKKEIPSWIDECTTLRRKLKAEKTNVVDEKVGKSTRQRKNSNERTSNDNGKTAMRIIWRMWNETDYFRLNSSIFCRWAFFVFVLDESCLHFRREYREWRDENIVVEKKTSKKKKEKKSSKKSK